MKPVFLKFTGYNGDPIVINVSKVVSFYAHDSTRTILDFGEDERVYVQCNFDDVCKAIENWYVFGGSLCK